MITDQLGPFPSDWIFSLSLSFFWLGTPCIEFSSVGFKAFRVPVCQRSESTPYRLGNWSASLSLSLFLSRSVCLAGCLPVCLLACLPAWLAVCLSVCLSVAAWPSNFRCSPTSPLFVEPHSRQFGAPNRSHRWRRSERTGLREPGCF